MNHYIIAIVGPSGAGKTSISLAMRKAGIPDVVSYTTRPMRDGEVQNREHIFISEDHAKATLACVDPMAYTEIAGYRYFTLAQQFTLSEISSYVIDEEGLCMLNQNVKEMNIPDHQFIVFPIYVSRDSQSIAESIDSERINRDKERRSLDMSTYQIIVHNDAPSTFILEVWAESFAHALLATLGRSTVYKVELNTSDISVLSILSTLVSAPSDKVDLEQVKNDE